MPDTNNVMCARITDISVSTDNGNSTIRYQWKPDIPYCLNECTVKDFYCKIEGGCSPGDFIKDTVEGSSKNLVLLNKTATLELDGTLIGESQWRTVSPEEAYFGMPVINFRIWNTTIAQDSVYLGLAYCRIIVEKPADICVDSSKSSPTAPITATNGQTFDEIPQNIVLTATHSVSFNLCDGQSSIVCGLMALNGTINKDCYTVPNATIAPGTGLMAVQVSRNMWKHELTGETGFYYAVNIEIRHNPLGFWAIIPNTGTFKWSSSTKVPIANNPQTLSVVTRDGRGYLNKDGTEFVDVKCSNLLYFQMYQGSDWKALDDYKTNSDEFPTPMGWQK